MGEGREGGVGEGVGEGVREAGEREEKGESEKGGV